MTRASSRQLRGFTLLELVLVMIIIITAVAIAAPQLQGWARGSKLRNSADEFLKVSRYARSQSIADATLYRIEFQSTKGKYQLKKQNLGTGTLEFQTLPGQLGKEYSVPDGGQLQLTVETSTTPKVAGDNLECIDFYPTGRVQPASVRLADGKGSEIEIKCESPAEDFHVAYEGKAQNK